MDIFLKRQAMRIGGYVNVVFVLSDEPMFEFWVNIFMLICICMYSLATFVLRMFIYWYI